MDASRFLPKVRWQRWTLAVIAVFVVLALSIAHFMDEPLRRRIEAGVNASLKGYKVTIGRCDFHPFGFSLDLENSIVIQEANPKPPMAEVPLLTASVQWRSLLLLKLVADFKIVEPKLHFDTRQGEAELKDEMPVQERGWQEAAYEIYPLKINEIRIVDGEISFKPEGEFKPLELRDVDARAANIRNIRSRDREYPSDLSVDAVVFDNGTLRIDGNADFLAEPYAGVLTEIEIDKLPLSYLTGVVHDYAQIRKGTFSGKGELEYAPKIQRVDLENIQVDGADADYVLTNANYAKSEEMRKTTIKEAKKVSNAPDVQLRAKQVRISDSTLGFVDRREKTDFRLFFAGLDVTAKDFSNQTEEGAGTVNAKGKFNGTGPATLHAVFRPQTKSPNFDLDVGINNAELRQMNDFLKAKAGVDVTRGTLSYYSEMKVRNAAIDGYVKVLFRDLNVYDPVQDKEKPFLSKAKEFLADGVANVLENRNTDIVATRASLSGPLENPNADMWEIIGALVRNAFIQAILPGLEGKVPDTGGMWSEANRKAAMDELGPDKNVDAKGGEDAKKGGEGKDTKDGDDRDKGMREKFMDKLRSIGDDDDDDKKGDKDESGGDAGSHASDRKGGN